MLVAVECFEHRVFVVDVALVVEGALAGHEENADGVAVRIEERRHIVADAFLVDLPPEWDLEVIAAEEDVADDTSDLYVAPHEATGHGAYQSTPSEPRAPLRSTRSDWSTSTVSVSGVAGSSCSGKPISTQFECA